METDLPSAIDIQVLPFHALIIGIDKYPGVTQLSGAVADAKAIEQYLMAELGVVKDQITTLHDEQATRDAIIDGFNAIRSNSSINKGDPILIYFAGHGVTSAAPAGWNSAGFEIQCLVPFDYDLIIDGAKVSAVPDRTIAVLLDGIAEMKGDNITVIFDCCHSGSGSRDPKALERGLKGRITISAELDRNIWGSHISGRKAKIPTGFLNKGLRSHVLLAACSATESAKERNQRGVFTAALIQALETFGVDSFTYNELIHQIGGLEKGRQNPQCEGENRGRRLFDAKAKRPQRGLYRVENKDGEYVLKAGTAHGITEGSRFEIYRQYPGIVAKTPVGFLTATKPQDFTTVMTLPDDCPSFNLNGSAFALQLSHGNDTLFRVHIKDQQLQRALWPCVEKVGLKTSNTSRDPGTILSIAMEDGSVVFSIPDNGIHPLPATQIPICIPFDVLKPPSDAFDQIERIFRATIRYYRHLSQKSQIQDLRRAVYVQFNKLHDSNNGIGLQEMGLNLLKNQAVDLVVDKDANYGLKIVNKSHTPLYPFVFFFSSDLSIECFYRPGTSGGKVDVPLPPKESITIGYGSAGGSPISFSLDPGEDDYDKSFRMRRLDNDITFVKIYISTVPIDLSDLEQDSPFQPVQPEEDQAELVSQSKIGGRKAKRDKPNLDGLQIEQWDAIIIPVVQRRFPMSIFEKLKAFIMNWDIKPHVEFLTRSHDSSQ